MPVQPSLTADIVSPSPGTSVRLADFTTCPRALLISAAAQVVGIVSTLAAYALTWLIAVARMLDNDIGRLPVVDPAAPSHLLGYLGRAAILSARLRLHREETVHPRP